MCICIGRGALGLAAVLYFVLATSLFAQESEPNDPCIFAQPEDATTLPFSITGSLDSSESVADVDFFRFTANAGDGLRVDLEGSYTGAGSLTDPFLGLFDASCTLIQTNDDHNGLNSRLVFTVPDDGEFVLGVSNCCDYEFLGGGQGSYTLGLEFLEIAGSISGSLVDAETLAPLPGDGPPWTYVQLVQCDEYSGCSQVSVSGADGAGAFHFDSAFNGGEPLLAGRYQIYAQAQGYQELISDEFEVAANEHLDVGALGMNPLPLIGSVSGRLVDALDDTPLAGNGPPFASTYLARCDEFTCFQVAWATPDESGRFQFDALAHLIVEGEYLVVGQGDTYYPTESARITIGRGEHVNIGDLALQPVPVRFGDMHQCELIVGQNCRFGVDIGIRVAKRLRAEAWGMVQFIPYTTQGIESQFQVGRQGVKNPSPQPLNLRTGETHTLMFEFPVPDQVPDGFLMCASVYVGTTPGPQYNVLATQHLFCAQAQAGALRMMSEKEARKALREQQGRNRN